MSSSRGVATYAPRQESINLGIMWTVKIDKADEMFSIFIRVRDKWCQRCKRFGGYDANGRQITGLQNSHYFGRGRESTRFDPQNCDALCAACHLIWGSNDKEGYREFKIKQIGMKAFKALRIRAALTGRKDRKLALIVATNLLEDLENGNR